MARIGSFNLMILMETKIADQAYFQNRMVYDVVCSKAITTTDGDTQEGVGTIIWNQPQGWSIESTLFHRPKLVS